MAPPFHMDLLDFYNSYDLPPTPCDWGACQSQFGPSMACSAAPSWSWSGCPCRWTPLHCSNCEAESAGLCWGYSDGHSWNSQCCQLEEVHHILETPFACQLLDDFWQLPVQICNSPAPKLHTPHDIICEVFVNVCHTVGKLSDILLVLQTENILETSSWMQ